MTEIVAAHLERVAKEFALIQGEAKWLINRSEELASNGEAHRSDISLARGRELEAVAVRMKPIVAAALAACVRESRQGHWQEFLDARGVIDTCTKCGGTGTVTYGSTAIWRGGIGGQAMTSGVCDKCWGSGDEHRHWTNLRALERAAGEKPGPEGA